MTNSAPLYSAGSTDGDWMSVTLPVSCTTLLSVVGVELTCRLYPLEVAPSLGTNILSNIAIQDKVTIQQLFFREGFPHLAKWRHLLRIESCVSPDVF